MTLSLESKIGFYKAIKAHSIHEFYFVYAVNYFLYHIRLESFIEIHESIS